MQRDPLVGGRNWLGVFAIAVAGVAMFVWPERGHAEEPGRYVVATEGTIAGGTVYDTKTNLTWQRESPAVGRTWARAQTECATLGEGWRLPSFKELATLVTFSSTVDRTAFAEPNADSYSDGDGGTIAVSHEFWGAPASKAQNSDGNEAETAYVVGSVAGGIDVNVRFTANESNVRLRCVRTGQP